MRVQGVLALAFGVVMLTHAGTSSAIQGVMRNFTNLRERLPEMVAQLGAAAYEEFSEESSRSVEEDDSPNERQKYKRLASAEEGVEYEVYQGVMGRPGVDFPVLQNIPRTDFTCKKVKNSGYYADLDTDCQVFHICDQGRKISFLCPNGTIFRQSHLICDWWWTVDCGGSVELYESSAEQLASDQRAYKERANQKPHVSNRGRQSIRVGDQEINQRGAQTPTAAARKFEIGSQEEQEQSGRQGSGRSKESLSTASSVFPTRNQPPPSQSSPSRSNEQVINKNDNGQGANNNAQRPQQGDVNSPQRITIGAREGRRFNLDSKNSRRQNNQQGSHQRVTHFQGDNFQQNSKQGNEQGRNKDQQNQQEEGPVNAKQAQNTQNNNNQNNQQVKYNSQLDSQQTHNSRNHQNQQTFKNQQPQTSQQNQRPQQNQQNQQNHQNLQNQQPQQNHQNQQPQQNRQNQQNLQNQQPQQNRQNQQPQQNQPQQSTPRPKASGKSYNNVRYNYGTTGGENESQISSETASFVSSKGNQFSTFQQSKFLQPPVFNNFQGKGTFDYSTTTYPAVSTGNPDPSSKLYVELDRSKSGFPSSTPSTATFSSGRRVAPEKSGPSANQPPQAALPKFRTRIELTDEDVFSNRGRGPPTREFYQSTSTEVIPITDVVQPSGSPFTSEDVTRQQATGNAGSPSPNRYSKDYVELDRSQYTATQDVVKASTEAPSPTLAVGLSRRVKPIYIHVTTREGRTSTESTVDVKTETETITEVVTQSSGLVADFEALSKAIATLGPHLNPQYSTTTETVPNTDFVKHNCTPFNPVEIANSQPSEVVIPHVPSITEEPPLTDVFQPTGLQSNNDDAFTTRYPDENLTIQPLSVTELPPNIDTVQPTRISLDNAGVFISTVYPEEQPTLSNTELPPFEYQTTNLYEESDRGSKELKYKDEIPNKVVDDAKIRASVLHSTLDEIVYGTLGNSVLNETLTTSSDEQQRKPFAESGRGASKFSPNGIPAASPSPNVPKYSPSSTVLPGVTSPEQSFEPIATTFLPPEIYRSASTYSGGSNSLTIENSKRDPITIEPANENSILAASPSHSVDGDRTGLEIPTASGPGVLHSLAVYFGAKEETATSTEPTVPEDSQKDELLVRSFSNNPDASLGVQSIIEGGNSDSSGAAPSLLTQFTKDSYQALFPETAKDSTDANDTDSANLLQAQSSGGLLNNELNESKATAADVSEFKFKMSENTSNLRELAQVFSRALSAYLEDPEEFRKVLSEVRPTPPGIETTSSSNNLGEGTTPVATTKEYSDHEEDEVLEYSDDSKTHKRPTIQKIYSQQEQEKEKKKSTVDRKGKVLVSASVVTYHHEIETTTYAPVTFQLSDLTDPTRLPFETLENSQSSYYSSPQQQISTGNSVASEIKNENSGDESLSNYNLPEGTKQFEGPSYGPQPGDKKPIETEAKVAVPRTRTRHRFAGFNNDYRSQLRSVTTVIPQTTEDTTTYVPSTTPGTTQGSAEGTTFQYVNQYDGYPIPVLNSDLTPPFEPSGLQNVYPRDNDTLLVYFAPEDLNNLAVFNASEDLPTTDEPPTTTEERFREITTLPPTTTTTTTTTTTSTTETPIQTDIVTNAPANQYVRFNAKEERQGRRVSFSSRNSEAGESLVRAHSASFSSSRNSKELTNQRNTINVRASLNRLATVAVNPFSINEELVEPEYIEPTTTTTTTTAPEPKPSKRPVIRRRFKSTTTGATDAPSAEELLLPTEQPFFLQRVQQTHLVVDTSSPSSIGVIEQRYRSTTVKVPTKSAQPIVYTTTPEPIPQTIPPMIVLPQNFERPSVLSSVSYNSKTIKSQRRFKSSTSKPFIVVETTTEPERPETVPPTVLPEITTTLSITEMPAEKEMSMEAEMMFGKLNESSINHLMDMMKMAESNMTVRRLVLLLVNHGPQNKTTEESRRQLIDALLRTPDEVPAESQQEAISSPIQQLNSTTSMKVSMTVGTSSKVSNRRGKNIRTSHDSNRKSNFIQSTTTPPVLATTYRNNARRVVYKPTVPTTTKRSVERKRLATSTSTTTTMKLSTSSGNSTVMAKKVYEKLTNDSTGTTGALTDSSDNRAIDLLRSLYSLAARFG